MDPNAALRRAEAREREITAELSRLADERHSLLSQTPRPADADDRLAAISGRQAELVAEREEIFNDDGA